MPRVVPRETFIALRARRQAYRIASSIRDPQVLSDPATEGVVCHHCGDYLHLDDASESMISCSCGQTEIWPHEESPTPEQARAANTATCIAWGLLIALMVLAVLMFIEFLVA